MKNEKWRGIGKLIEECGEVLQLCGKVIPFPDGPHPDGKGALRDRLPVELADLKAAIHYFEQANNLAILEDRASDKLRQFTHWGLTGIMDLRAPVLSHDMGCALHIGKECDCDVASRTTGPAPDSRRLHLHPVPDGGKNTGPDLLGRCHKFIVDVGDAFILEVDDRFKTDFDTLTAELSEAMPRAAL